MATSSLTVRPSPIDIARTAAAAMPAEVSAQPLLGILGVVMGAGVVTLTSRMISLGMPDFRGLHGFGYDESAWIGSAFDAGLMFIGPFTVYLGGLMGPRRILLTAAALFTVLFIFLPFAHSYSLVIAMALLGGLSSGTFYPLTLTFALRNIPLRYLPFTLVLYAVFVDGAVNIAPSLYGWYRNYLSSNWMFWNSALITPLMMICIYYGIPKTKAAKKSGEAPSFAGFLYASAGLALLLSPANKGKGSTGGTPEYSTHCSPAGRSCCCARWFGGYAVRILWWRYLICWRGTPRCWDCCSSGFASLFARPSF